MLQSNNDAPAYTCSEFHELYTAKILSVSCATGGSLRLWVWYGETFARCFTGSCEVKDYEDLKLLHKMWIDADRSWDGVVAWMSVKFGEYPIYYYLEQYKKNNKLDWKALELKLNSLDQFERDRVEYGVEEALRRDRERKKNEALHSREEQRPPLRRDD